MKKLKFVFVPVIVLVLSFFWLFPQIPGLLWAEQHGYARYGKGLFSDSTIAPGQLFRLNRSVARAETKIKDFWGSHEGKGIIIFCQKESEFAGLCGSGKGAGCSIGTPWKSWIVLNADGLNEDVIAHEMCHIELMTRLGWWNVKTGIPTWLDEGLALQVDDRFVGEKDSIQRYIDYKAELEMYSNGNQWEIPLTELETNKQFFGDEYRTRLAYLTAATEVSKILTKTSKKEFLQTLERDRTFVPRGTKPQKPRGTKP